MGSFERLEILKVSLQATGKTGKGKEQSPVLPACTHSPHRWKAGKERGMNNKIK